MKGVLWTEQHNQGKISTYTDPGKELQPQGFRKLSTGFFKSIKKKKKRWTSDISSLTVNMRRK